MEALLNWFKHNWHDFGELVGLFVGIGFTAIAWKLQFLATITEKHRALSMWIAEHPDVHRIYSKTANANEQPINVAESKALNMIFAQYETGWDIARFLDRKRLKPLANDIQKFFALPLPHAAWEKHGDCHHPRFVRFVIQAVEAGRPL